MLLTSRLNNVSQRLLRRVPAGPLSALDIDPLEVPARQQGIAQADIEDIWRRAERVCTSGMHPMVSLCVRRGGDMLINRSVGVARAEPSAIPASLETPVCLFSASKAVTAMLIHKLGEEGKLDLLNPVSHYIPDFAQGGKARITILQLLSHRAGVPGISASVPTEILFDHRAALAFINSEPALDRDGRVLAYHAVTSGFVLAELLRIATGKTVNEYLDEIVRQPMGMRYFQFGLPPTDRALAAENYITGMPLPRLVARQFEKILGAPIERAVQVSNTADFMDAQIPSANLYATAEEACRFFQMLLQDGRWQDQQIFSPLTVQRAVREVGPAQLDRSLVIPMRYSAGMMLGGRPVGLYGRNTHEAFGHIGLSNILCWADPDRDLSVAFLTTGKAIVGSHLPALLGLIDRISRVFRPCA